MTMEAFKRYTGTQRPYTAASLLLAGAIVALGGAGVGVGVGVVTDDIASGDSGTVETAGRFAIASASATTFAVGDPVYWDNSGKVAVKTWTAIYVGLATKAKVSGDLTVEVDLNAARPEFIVSRVLTSTEGTNNYVDIDVGYDVGSTSSPKCVVDAQVRSTSDGTVYSTAFAITHNPGGSANTTVRIAGTDLTTGQIIYARITRLLA